MIGIAHRFDERRFGVEMTGEDVKNRSNRCAIRPIKDTICNDFGVISMHCIVVGCDSLGS